MTIIYHQMVTIKEKNRIGRINQSVSCEKERCESKFLHEINIFVLFGFLAIAAFSGLLRFASSFLASLIVVRVRELEFSSSKLTEDSMFAIIMKKARTADPKPRG